MAKSRNQKLKLPCLIQILKEKTDEDHGLSAEELIRELARYDLSAERKSIYDDIALLQDCFGMVIEHDRAKGYRLMEQDLDLPELKMLVDAVQSSKFISLAKSEELIRKLKGLTSEHHAKELQRQVTVKNRIKSMNNTTIYSIDTIHNAILNDRQITFQYWSWTPNKEQAARHNGKKYQVSPWMLLWDDEYYYLIAYDEENAQIRHYRVDRMRTVCEIKDRRMGRESFEAIDVAEYSTGVFGMFGGEITHVTFGCKNSMADVVLDRFGKDVMMTPLDEGFQFHADINVSPQFFGWVASFGGEIKIVSPQTVADQFKEHLQNALKQYQ
ncbi:MAG: WYL domain-containing protein [Clostridia bacterium]|nr:WYL domain-containing protein [Clostridia bacterium]